MLVLCLATCYEKGENKRATDEYFEKRSGERNVDSRIQVQLEEDGGGSTRQSTELDGDKWSVAYVPPGMTRRKSGQVKKISLEQSISDVENAVINCCASNSLNRYEFY